MKIFKSGSRISFVTDSGELILSDKIVSDLELQDAYFKGDEELIKELLVDGYKTKKEVIEVHNKSIEKLDDIFSAYPDLFEHKNEAYYRKGIEVSLPETIINAYLDPKNDFKSIDNFWLWLCLNPNEESRQDLITFIKHHGMHITKEGLVLGYRRVISKQSSNKAYIDFISNEFLKVRTRWKKNPDEYFVYRSTENKGDNEYLLIHYTKKHENVEYIGNLKKLYLDLENETLQFTDSHTKSYNYKIGIENRMDRSQGNQSNLVSCSTGFHVASKHYDYGSFGDTPVLVVFNPTDVLASPKGEVGKLRVCAFTILSTLKQDEDGKLLENEDVDYSDLLSEVSHSHLEKLDSLLNSTTLYESTINNKINKMTVESINGIRNTLMINSDKSNNSYSDL